MTESLRTLPNRADQRPARPGHASKIITAGLSTSLVLGIVSYLGNAANAAQAAKQAAVPAVQAPTVTVPATNGTPQVIVVGVPAASTPVAAAPQAAPVPAVTTSGTTKASG